MHKSEIKEMLAITLRKLVKGEVRPDVAQGVASLTGRQIAELNTEIIYAKARGDKPLIPELENDPASQAGTTLAKVGANKRATANSRS